MLAKRLISLRKENKKTQQQIADYLGITRPAYTAYERETRQPDYETLQKLADFFDVTTDYLLGRSDTVTYKGIPLSEEDREMVEFFKNPEVNLFFKEMKNSPEGQLEELREIWEVIKRRGLNKK